eukprot:GFUD01031219.1.p1 GENE.GFUD01031219.1~~GFUD01031219.1.p1  ORF type:complete len:342 (+),score=105.45 GFUD01031219.1:184-1209(+)
MEFLKMIEWFLVNLWFKICLNIIGAIYVVKEQILSRPRCLPSYSSQTGKTIVITGGGRGIGLEAVKKLVRLGARVIMGCRSPDLVKKKFDAIIKDYSRGGSVEVYPLDLMSLASVRSFAQTVISLDCPVHVLINNAGIMFGDRKETEDGFESQLATNYLGHFLLSHMLLPVMERTGQTDTPARIVNVSSCAHYWGAWMDFNDMHLRDLYSPEKAYGNSKAAQIMFTSQLDTMLKSGQAPVKVLSLHPGVVYTDLYTNVSWVKIFTLIAKLLMKTAEQGGDTLVHAALDPDLVEQGKLDHPKVFLENCRLVRSSSFTSSVENQVRLWLLTCSMLGIKQFGKY